MRFIWFWTFWHWSKESFRDGSLLRGPLHGIGGHWDEWFRHEASQNERQAIEEIGRTESTQRQFIAWLFRHWARETDWRGNRMVPRFVLGQLAHLPPFNRWQAFESYRTDYGVGGISAVVLSTESRGEAEDVRRVEALVLPADGAPTIVPEGFKAGPTELDATRRAARSLLCGKGLLILLAFWIAIGRRPYPRWLTIALGLGWLAVGGLILYLLLGPDPGEWLFLLSASLVALWGGLILGAIAMAATQSFHAWNQGRIWSAQLNQSQVRLRMNGGLTLKGESAGLPFCLNTLLALYRSNTHPACRSWLWQRLFRKLRSETGIWAATGVVTADGYLKPVVLEPKLRACLQHAGIRHILTPRQRGAGLRVINRLADGLTPARREDARVTPFATASRLGFAAEKRSLRSHCCLHAAQSMLTLGGFTSKGQTAANAFALVLSATMAFALPDLRSILLPHPAPTAIPPASSSPYYLWVSLDTKHSEYFSVVLESGFWSNRRSEVKSYGGITPSVRAELRLHRLTRMTIDNEEDGSVWIERRRRFLTREFAPGERVGRYSISYLTHLGHE